MNDRLNGVVALIQWRKLLQEYIWGKKQQLSGNGRWHMPFLIRYLKSQKCFFHCSFLEGAKTNWKWPQKSHELQWRASSGHSLGLVNFELGKTNWGWSWKERWIAARPWESRVPVKSASPKKVKNKQAKKVDENTKLQTKITPVSSKPSLSNGRVNPTARRLSYPPAEKGATLERSIKSDAANTKREHSVS